MNAGRKTMVRSQAENTPNATNSPNTWTGGIGARANDAKATAVVREVKVMGVANSLYTARRVDRRSRCCG